MTATQDNMVAELQRANAELRQELAARTAELAQRNSEYGERIEQQSATVDVLKLMSASPGDPQPVFDLITRRAAELCNSRGASIFEYDGELVHFRSRYHQPAVATASAFRFGTTEIAQASRFFAAFPMRPERGSLACRAILDRQVIHTRDTQAEPDLLPSVRDLGIRSILAIPLLRDDNAVGAFAMNSEEPGGFTESQVALLQTFAEQAVIAITSAETYRALQERTAALAARNSEYGERIEQQAATIDVLKVMSGSPGNAQPVFELIVERARTFCGADQCTVALLDGDMLHLKAKAGMSEASARNYAAQFPRPVNTASMFGRAILAREAVQTPDVSADPEHFSRTRVGGPDPEFRAIVAVPMLRAGTPIGAIALVRRMPGVYSAIQLELLQTFAEQAVIAITSAETYLALQTRTSDLQETLEYQTATNEVLKVISQSTFDLQPVLDTVVETAARLCDADQAAMARPEGDFWRLAANFGFPAEYEAYYRATGAIPYGPDAPSVTARAVREKVPVHIHDVAAIPGYPDVSIRLGKQRTSLAVPLLREGQSIGVIVLGRQRVEPFTDRQIELVSTFADQAVIAIENTRLITEQREALEQQTATAEVLQVINASPGNLTPVFEAILEKAHDLCDIAHGDLQLYDGEHLHSVAQRGLSAEFANRLRQGYRASDSPASRPLLAGDRFTHITDAAAVDSMVFRSSVRPDGIRTVLFVPLRKDGSLLGMITSARREVRPFTEKEIALLENFAAQAVIAMENARLITETREALEQQTATAEVLQVINASPGNLAPVFDTVLEKAMRLCGAAFGSLFAFDGKGFQSVAQRGVPTPYAEFRKNNPPKLWPGSPIAQLIATRRTIHVLDFTTEDIYRFGDADARSLTDLGDARTILFVPLLKDDAVLGFISIFRQEVRAFSDKQIALLENFAAQAVIAMESARLLHELRARTDELAQRQAELRITFENMGDGVAMFDETQHLVAWNRKFQDILDVPDDIIARRQTFSEYVHYLAERGEYGPGADPEEHVRGLIEQAGRSRTHERTRPDGRVIEIRQNPVPGGGFVLIYADITERKRNEAEIRAARDAAEEASRTIEAAYRDLKAAQANLIQAEKMASLGQLTAGIAHEIKNPLNFVNNFSALSTELIDELRDVLAPEPLGETTRTEVDDLTALLKGNLEKVVQHGQRADGIVRSMLDHSRGSSGERRMVDLNALIDEALNLAYHGARAQDQSFNITLERDFGEGMAPIEVNPQDITRVFLNIFSNGFYAATRRARDGGDAGFVPTLKVTTRDAGEAVEIRVRDNGTGIPADIRDKLFQPFFTTKPTGEGTGLGLSITYDIITQQHGGNIAVDSKVGEYSEFTIQLPRYRP